MTYRGYVRVHAGPRRQIIGVPEVPSTVSFKGLIQVDGQDLERPEGMTIAWSKVVGFGQVQFNPPDALTTQATFTRSGIYVLRLKISYIDEKGRERSVSDYITRMIRIAAPNPNSPNSQATATATPPQQ